MSGRKMSYHFQTPAAVLPGVLSRAHEGVRSPVLWLASTPLPHLQRLVFLTVGGLVLAKKSACPSQRALAAMFDRTPRTIRRALHALKDQGLIRVVRRGNTLTNVYLLARRI
ncbi:MAG: helix-turn-helix domain-containing protein [Candidatus Methylomirabilales bacterium]